MPSLLFVLPFVFLTVICWGNYGVLMHHGQDYMGGSSLRPFIGVGFSYFVIAVLVPLMMLKRKPEKGHWSIPGTTLSIFAGSVGAVGALGVIMAFKFKGNPVYVMPLVFGGAPVVNTIVTMWMTRSFRNVNRLFLLGVLLVVVGAAAVLQSRPTTDTVLRNDPTAQQSAPAVTPPADPARSPVEQNYLMILLSIGTAALCWGSYGPLLHKGQMKMGGSRLRPFLCVGIAYFAIAVAVPLIVLAFYNEPGGWTTEGIVWSLAGGVAGAMGALGIVLAFNFGGKPIFVMPLVFGFAPVMNTITTITERGIWDQVGLFFVGSLLVVITGAVLVLIFAPQPAPPTKPPAAAAPEESKRVVAPVGPGS